MGSDREVDLAGQVRELEQQLVLLRQSLDHEHESHERVQTALRDSEERFEMIAESIPQLVWTTRHDGVYEYFNQRWMNYTGVTLDQMTTDWDWSALIHPDDHERTLERWNHSLATGKPYDAEYRFLRARDKKYRWFLAKALPLRNRQGQIVRWFGTCTDIEDQKQAEAELAAAKVTAEEANKAKSQFLASMSHELRTPLNAIIGYSEMLQEEVEEMHATDLSKDLTKIHSAGKHLLSLISDILDLSKIEAGKMDIYVEEFDVIEAVQDVLNTVEALVEQNGNVLERAVPPNLGCMRSDVTKVRQSLFNLLSNASKFTENGRITLEASAAMENGREWVQLQVRDTGIGIPPEKLAHILEPFTQVPNNEVTRAAGTGLGLALTKNFCELLGGKLTVESEVDKGSTFTITLPRMVKETTDTEHHGSTPAANDQADRNQLVLVVDDDASARDLIQRYLTREGFQTRTAATGPEALRLAQELRPSVITLDVLMPGMDGLAVLQALKADPDLAATPVVMVSTMSDRSLGAALGAADYLTKPIAKEKLLAVMAKYWQATPPSRVLIVDDDESSKLLVKTIFERGGWRATTASDGAEALAAVQREEPTLILLDLMMPIMDGFEFTTALRRNPRYTKIPIIVLTAKDVTAEDRARLDGSVKKVFSKGSITAQDLMKELRQVVAGRK
jgi:PAS domain S-box-containing protein